MVVYKFRLDAEYEVCAYSLGEAMLKVTRYKSLRDEFMARLKLVEVSTDVNVEGGD